MLIILGFLLFVALVVVHELGHFIAAKKSGVEVEEFGIGFPPRLWGRRFKNDKTLYSINLLPLGGFVKLKGEHDADKEKGSYGATSFRRKTLIILSGVAMNFAVAALLLSYLSFKGLPSVIDNQFKVASDTVINKREVIVGFVEPESAAEQAGLEVGDGLKSFAGIEITKAEQLFILTRENLGREVEITVQRGDGVLNLEAKLPDTKPEKGILGVEPVDVIYEKSTWSAPIRGVVVTSQLSREVLFGVGRTLKQLVSGQGSEAAKNVTGPIGIVVLLEDVSNRGINNLLLFISLISITLAVMNTLPIPALDGGRLFVSAVFKILRKPLSVRTEERIHGTGMAVLLVLIALISVVDVKRFL